MRVLVLQHIRCESPGTYSEVLDSRRVEAVTVELDEGEPAPAWQEFDAIVAMGGPMNVDEDATYPWLTQEKTLIADAVQGGLPYWGVCLGAQLLARSLGARVFQGPAPEVGLGEVVLTEEGLADPVVGRLPPRFLTLQWHGDTFDLPKGASLLASSESYPNQVFRCGRYAYGVQFHLEVSPEMCSEWAGVPEYAAALHAELGPGGEERLVSDVRAEASSMHSYARSLFAAWLDAISDGPSSVDGPRVDGFSSETGVFRRRSSMSRIGHDEDMEDDRVRVPSLQEATYEKLRLALMEGRILDPSGARGAGLQGIATRLGVSTMPVREAVRRLEAEGLVTFSRADGVRPRVLSRLEFEEMTELRVRLETLAFEQAAMDVGPADLDRLRDILKQMAQAADRKTWRSLNYAFHDALYSPGRYKRLLAMIHTLRIPVEAYLQLFTSDPPDLSRPSARDQLLLTDHQELYDAMERRDVEAGVALVERHIRRFQELVLERMSKDPDTDDRST